MRGKNLIKLLTAIDLLSKPEGVTIGELGDRLGIDRRSVYRLISVIEDLGFPLYDDRIPLEREKRWKLVETYLKKLPNMNVPDINLSLSEIISLHLIKSQANVFKGTDIEGHIISAFGKLSLFLPKDILPKLENIKALFVSSNKSSKDYSGKEDLINQLMEAMLRKESCLVTYHSFYDNEIKNFKIDPLHFVEKDGGLYLFVNATTFGEIRILAVERIQKLTKTDSIFEYPEGFNAEELLESAFNIIFGDSIKVKIWFSADQARYIKERQWSKTQQIEDQDDGSIILSMETSGWWDVQRWVLSYGKEARVLEPDKLRETISSELESAFGHYRQDVV